MFEFGWQHCLLALVLFVWLVAVRVSWRVCVSVYYIRARDVYVLSSFVLHPRNKSRLARCLPPSAASARRKLNSHNSSPSFSERDERKSAFWHATSLFRKEINKLRLLAHENACGGRGANRNSVPIPWIVCREIIIAERDTCSWWNGLLEMRGGTRPHSTLSGSGCQPHRSPLQQGRAPQSKRINRCRPIKAGIPFASVDYAKLRFRECAPACWQHWRAGQFYGQYGMSNREYLITLNSADGWNPGIRSLVN